jgi:RNA polymerase subunit RPABC4/transcription elongation factor Spt4
MPSPQLVCPNCGQPLREGTRFCTKCGSKVVPGPPSEPARSAENQGADLEEDEEPAEISPPSEFDSEASDEATPPSEETEETEATPVPDEMLTSLVARGQQLDLENKCAETGSVSEDLIDDLSEAATNASIPLEELIDSCVNERSEQERLEGLRRTGEVSDRVFDRLTQEYDSKLADMDGKIREGVTTFRGYQAYLREEFAGKEDELETIKAKREVGDEEADAEDHEATLTKEAQRLRCAMAAITHVLDKAAAMHGPPASRFEVSETTVGATSPDEAPRTVAAKPASTRTTKPTADVEAGKVCPACGRVTTPNTKFCIYCGSRV